ASWQSFGQDPARGCVCDSGAARKHCLCARFDAPASGLAVAVRRVHRDRSGGSGASPRQRPARLARRHRRLRGRPPRGPLVARTPALALHGMPAPPISRLEPRGERMTQFDDRERAFETKFAHDEEMKFRITARRNRLLGEWASRQMGLSEAEAESYAKDVVRSDFEN